MPEGIYCNKRPVNTAEDLKALLADTRGTKYYEEMLSLEVDREKLWDSIQKTCKSRMPTMTASSSPDLKRSSLFQYGLVRTHRSWRKRPLGAGMIGTPG